MLQSKGEMFALSNLYHSRTRSPLSSVLPLPSQNRTKACIHTREVLHKLTAVRNRFS